MKAIIVAALLAMLLLFGCAQPQTPVENQDITPAQELQEISGIESELDSYESEFSEIDEILNDPELENIEFVELEESAFQ